MQKKVPYVAQLGNMDCSIACMTIENPWELFFSEAAPIHLYGGITFLCAINSVGGLC